MDTEQKARELRYCFYCANFHQLEPNGVCNCVCHKVAPAWDKLEAVEKGLPWTVPQLVAIQKLLTAFEREIRLDEHKKLCPQCQAAKEEGSRMFCLEAAALSAGR